MNNISQMLDRLRTLSTQSASGTFTGDRGILNNEFQSVLGQIDQQAQAIGLNQGGQFATNLAVYIGGGKDTTTGGFSASNGTLNINLSAATVDTPIPIPPIRRAIKKPYTSVARADQTEPIKYSTPIRNKVARRPR